LTAASSIADADLRDLAVVVDTYQEVLDGTKARLADIGYAATTRVKTTGTLVDKLRRETARLSVERLADRWGRGIRYGEDPEDPDAQVGELNISRREVLGVLKQLGELIARLEMSQFRIKEASSFLRELESAAEILVQAGGTQDWVLEEGVPPDLLERLTRLIASRPENDVVAVLKGWRRMTAAEFAETFRGGCVLARQHNESQAAELSSIDGELRAMLGRFADATGQG
jgi:hypothetical protein